MSSNKLFDLIYQSNIAALLFEMERSDINEVNIAKQSLLHVALAEGLDTIAIALIERGIDVNSQEEDGSTALHYAVTYHKGNLAERLVEAGARLDIADKHGNQPLWYAVHDPRRDHKLIAQLVHWGSDPEH